MRPCPAPGSFLRPGGATEQQTSHQALRELAAGMLEHGRAYPRTDFDRGKVSITDSLRLGDTVLLWATVPGQPERLAFLAGRWQQGRLVPASTATAMLSLAGRAYWHTAAGGTVSWHGPRGRLWLVEKVSGTATNDVVRVQLGDTPAMLKAYRLIGDGWAEHRILTAAARSQLAPRVLAVIGYSHAGGTVQAPLALVTEALTGQTLDVRLRRSLERAWQTGRSELSDTDRALLGRVSQAVRAWHGSPLPPYRAARQPLATRLPEVLADIGAVRQFLGLTAGGHRLLDLAASRAATLCASGDLGTGPAHGDLHLSHVLVDGSQIGFVDPAASAGLSASAPAPLEDFAALRRAVECMCLDVHVTERAAGWLAGKADPGRTRRGVSLALQAAAWADPGGPGRDLWAPLIHDSQSAAAARIADEWCANVGATLAGGYPGPAADLLYLARLMHDLRYHTERARTYHAGLAWWHLSRLLMPGDGGAAGRTAIPRGGQIGEYH